VIEASASAAPSTQDLIERLRRLLAGAPGVLVAYLYGLRARGRAGPLSDVDVAVLLDSDDEERRLELTAAIAEAAAPARADVVVLNNAPLALSYRVLRDGTILASRDDQARVQHWVRTVDRYLDMALRPGACWRPARATGCVGTVWSTLRSSTGGCARSAAGSAISRTSRTQSMPTWIELRSAAMAPAHW
jgi:uncharacterized protein